MLDSTETAAAKPTGLALMRVPFPAHQISKLPKPTKKQTDDLRAALERKDFSLGIRCAICGQYHHKDVVHLDYVGHAALTDRLLECDPAWNWEPVATRENGIPLTDENGGMWIRLTVCGVTRLGYGHPDGKKGGDAIKELIGDALRNAAMRFGAALDLWHKGDLHADDEPSAEPVKPAQAPRPAARQEPARDAGPSPVDIACDSLRAAETQEQLAERWRLLSPGAQSLPEVFRAKEQRKAQLKAQPALADEIRY
jgi:hypothetical protein